MIRISASAPGKILLCGEYAVLDGAPSLCVAVNRRASVLIQQNERGEHSVRSPGFADGSYRFSIDPGGGFNWNAGGEALPDFSILERVWPAQARQSSPSVDLVLDTGAFVEPGGGRKLGLGASAALTVALVGALARLQNTTTELDAMIEAHQQFQGGSGSGADVASAFSGGVIEYRRRETAFVRPMTWRNDLEYAVLWSGQSVSTVQKLSQLAASKADTGSRADLGRASSEIINAWDKAGAEAIISLFDRYTKTLAVFSDDHGLGIFDAGHAELVDLALSCGVVYKPCGAGGGDIGMALSADREAIDRFLADADSHGFTQLELRIDDNGLNVGSI